MKKLLFYIIFSFVFLESCAPRFSNNKDYGHELYTGYIPNLFLLHGVFINSLDPTHDTLVLGDGLRFTFLRKDSLGNNQIISGKWYEGPASDHPSENGHGNMYFTPDSGHIGFGCRVDIQDSGFTKFLVFDTLWQHYRFAKSELPRDFYKQRILVDSLAHIYSRKLLNSNGRPYRFVRKLIENNGRYY